jgi:ribosomal protein S18 acetylase RimI-like enzyme
MTEKFTDFDINLVQYNVTDDPFTIYDDINNLHMINFNQHIIDINEMDFVVYATYSNQIIGFCLLKKLSNEFETTFAIYSLNVLNQYRNYGIASHILSYVKQFVKNLNNQYIIILGVTNHKLIPFYEKNGFYIYRKSQKNIIPHENTNSYVFMRH